MTVFDPYSVSKPTIPDLNLKPAVSKTILTGETYTEINAAGGLILFNPYTASSILRMYRLTGDTNKYRFVKEIVPEERMSENYDWFRPVSAAMTVQSATIASGKFSVSGTMNAISFSSEPTISTLSYDNITAQRQDERGCKKQIPVQSGIVFTAPPDENHEYSRFESNNYQSAENAWTWTSPATNEYWPSATDVTVTVFDGSAGGSQELQTNFRGYYTLNALVACSAAGIAPLTVSVISVYYTCGEDGNEQSYDAQTFNFIVGAEAGMNYIPIHYSGFEAADLGHIVITLHAGVNLTTSASNANQFVQLHNYSIARRGIGPGLICAWKGVDPGNQVTMQGIVNYEAVPNQNLIRNVKCEPHPVADPLQIARVDTLFMYRDEFGLNTIYEVQEFENMRNRLKDMVIGERQVAAEDNASSGSRFKERLLGVLRGSGKVARFMGDAGRSLGFQGPGVKILRTYGQVFDKASSPITEEQLAMLLKRLDETSARMEQVLEENRLLKSQATAKNAGVAPTALKAVAKQFNYATLALHEEGGPLLTKGQNMAVPKMIEYFTKGRALEYNYYSALFPVVRETGEVWIGHIVVTALALATPAGRDFEYNEGGATRDGQFVYVDKNLLAMSTVVETINYRADWDAFDAIYVTYLNSEKPLGGESFQASLYLAVQGIPTSALVTGCFKEEVSDVDAKAEFAAKVELPLLVFTLDGSKIHLAPPYVDGIPAIMFVNDPVQLMLSAMRWAHMPTEIAKVPKVTVKEAFNWEAHSDQSGAGLVRGVSVNIRPGIMLAPNMTAKMLGLLRLTNSRTNTGVSAEACLDSWRRKFVAQVKVPELIRSIASQLSTLTRQELENGFTQEEKDGMLWVYKAPPGKAARAGGGRVVVRRPGYKAAEPPVSSEELLEPTEEAPSPPGEAQPPPTTTTTTMTAARTRTRRGPQKFIPMT
jgi:hypothetical protein